MKKANVATNTVNKSGLGLVQINMDEYGLMTDEQLGARWIELQGLRDKAERRAHHVTIEEELAFVQREQGIRKLRREKHVKYEAANGFIDEEIDEESLPVTGDNYEFVKVHSRWKDRQNKGMLS